LLIAFLCVFVLAHEHHSRRRSHESHRSHRSDWRRALLRPSNTPAATPGSTTPVQGAFTLDSGYATAKAECTEDFNNTCKFLPADVWVGKYEQTLLEATLSQAEVTFTFATHGYVMETNKLGVQQWNRFLITDTYLAVQQFAAWPASQNRNCSVLPVAKYRLKWTNDCLTAQIDAIVEPCAFRQALYNTMQFSLQSPLSVASAPCEFTGGSGIWQGKYSDRIDPYTQQPQVGTFTFAPNGAVVETSESAVYFYRVSETAPGNYSIADYGSQDNKQQCMVLTSPTPAQRVPVPIQAPYSVKWGGNCTTTTFSVINDTCASRAERLNKLTLVRVPLK